jgi:hypothetical protein
MFLMLVLHWGNGCRTNIKMSVTVKPNVPLTTNLQYSVATFVLWLAVCLDNLKLAWENSESSVQFAKWQSSSRFLFTFLLFAKGLHVKAVFTCIKLGKGTSGLTVSNTCFYYTVFKLLRVDLVSLLDRFINLSKLVNYLGNIT